MAQLMSVRAAGSTMSDKVSISIFLPGGWRVAAIASGRRGFGRISERPDALVDRDLADGLLTRDPRATRKLAAE
jgi:N-methylhydantoinase B